MDFGVCFPSIAEDIKKLQEWKEEMGSTLSSKDEQIAALQTELDGRKEEIAKLQEDIKGIKGEMTEGSSENMGTFEKRIKELEEQEVDTLKKDFDVRWAEVKPELEKVAEFIPRLAQQDLKLAETEAKSILSKEKCEEFEVRITKIDNEWAAYQRDEKKLQDIITKFDEGIKRVEGQQLELDAKYSKKYQQMWNEVPKAVEELNVKRIEQLEKQLQTNAADKVAEVQNLVKYCLQILSKVQADRKIETDTKNFLHHWREQSWINARRRMGMAALTKFLRSRIKDPFQTWKVQAMYETTIKRITAEYTRRIPDVPKQLDELGFPARIENLQDQLSRLNEDKASKDDVADDIEKTVAQFEPIREDIEAIQKDAGETKSTVSTLDSSISAAKDLVASVDESAKIAASKVEMLKEALEANYAQNTEVQAMVKDVLLIWYSIKQLDATKADKKDMEAYALESINREKASVREEVMSKNEEMRGELGNMQGNVEDIGRGFNEQQTQFVNLQQMLGNLASFVEELVVKIAEMQGVEVSGGAEKPASSMTNMEEMENWLHYAKGVVDQSLENYHSAQGAGLGGASRSGRSKQARPKSGAGAVDGISGRGLSAQRSGPMQRRRQ
ncbi:unnamed protein product [Amoebophrya sp. A25]|nr:unnamed protein product [Amoebophrya sp. A25]|eukprot:GSA25T00008130001.1